MNPCPLRLFWRYLQTLHLFSSTVTKYQKRISGPLLDRIDIHIQVPRWSMRKLSDARLEDLPNLVAARVEAARNLQRQRYEGTTLACNADMHPAQVRQFCALDEASPAAYCAPP